MGQEFGMFSQWNDLIKDVEAASTSFTKSINQRNAPTFGFGQHVGIERKVQHLEKTKSSPKFARLVNLADHKAVTVILLTSVLRKKAVFKNLSGNFVTSASKSVKKAFEC